MSLDLLAAILYLVSSPKEEFTTLSYEGLQLDDEFSVFFEQLEAYSNFDQLEKAFSENSKDEIPLTLSEEQLAQLQSDLASLDGYNDDPIQL